MKWLTRWYAKRIVNVNVNIIVAGALALLITVGVMTLFERWGLGQRINGKLGLGEKFIIGGVTFVVDLVADVLVYYTLHWLANHMPRQVPRMINPAYANLSFMKDATLVQFERAALSPILYIIALGGQHYLLHIGYAIGPATAIGFACGIGTSRVLHTIWMLLQEKSLLRKHHARTAAASDQAPGIRDAGSPAREEVRAAPPVAAGKG